MLREVGDENLSKFVSLSTWESAEHYEAWKETDLLREVNEQISTLQEGDKVTRIFEDAREDIFLL